MVQFFYEWDWDAAKKGFFKAIELNPNSADAHHYYSMFLIVMGDYIKAIKEAEIAVDLDPLSLPVNSGLAHSYAQGNMLDQAREQCQKTLELDPNFREALNGLGWIYYKMGETEKALEIFLKVQKLIGSELKGTAFLGYIYARMGKTEKAVECLKKLKIREAEDKEVSLHLDFAIVYIGLNDFDKAFGWLEAAYEEKLGGLLFIGTRNWKEIHDDPRYIQLRKKMNLP
jgi:tetratricopeptide (TPR) repeat protein